MGEDLIHRITSRKPLSKTDQAHISHKCWWCHGYGQTSMGQYSSETEGTQWYHDKCAEERTRIKGTALTPFKPSYQPDHLEQP